MENKILIVGAGSYGKIVCDAVISQGKYQVVGFLDDSLPVGTVVMGDYKVLAGVESIDGLKRFAENFVVALEDNNDRLKAFEEIKKILKPATIVHSSAVVSSVVTLGEGSVVLANAVVNSSVGVNSIVKPCVAIDHNCTIGDHVHLGIGTAVRSGVTVEDRYTTATHRLQLLVPNSVSVGGKMGGMWAVLGIILIMLFVGFVMVVGV